MVPEVDELSPVWEKVTIAVEVEEEKLADTVDGEFTAIVVGFAVPDNDPLHPANEYPDAGVAVNDTEVPATTYTVVDVPDVTVPVVVP